MKERKVERIKILSLRALVLLGLAFVGLWLLTGDLAGRSYYYYQGFDSTASAIAGGWTNIWATNQHWYGRDGAFFPPDEERGSGGTSPDYDIPSRIDIYNGKLSIWGRPNNNSLARNSTWWGKVAQFYPGRTTELSSNFSAFSTSPIGFYITRTHAHIDYDDDSRADNNYHKADINVWLVKDTPLSTPWDVYEGLIYFFEQASPENSHRSKLGYYSGAERWPTTTYGPTGQTYSFNYNTMWNNVYDDSPGALDSDNLNVYRVTGTIDNSNDNLLGIRFTHDGSRIKIYLNPNPNPAGYLGTGHPNEFFLFGNELVSWNTDMKVMIGHETSFFLTESVSAEYDDFVVRSVCKDLSASISPRKVLTDANIEYTVDVRASFEASDSGIGEILIAKPDFIASPWQLGTVSVEKNVSGSSWVPLTVETSGMPSTANQCRVMTYDNQDGRPEMLKLIFRTVPESDGSSGIIKSATTEQRLRIKFTLLTPALANSEGGEFAVYANLEKYREFTWSYAQLIGDASGGLPTTGMKRAKTELTDDLLVRSFGQPEAFASITSSPEVINHGPPDEVVSSVVYEISTKGIENCPDISQIKIEIPNLDFIVTNAKSLMINDEANVSIEEIGTNRYIILKYSDDAVGLFPGKNGYDRITFTMYGTPILPQGQMYEEIKFKSEVDSSAFIEGTSFQLTQTNQNYPSQIIKLAADNPVVSGYIFPDSIANATHFNEMQYTIVNSGGAYNRIRYLKIEIDSSLITNIANVSSALGGICSVFGDRIEIEYSGDGMGPGTDIISFNLTHNISNINQASTNVGFPLQANNGNGKGFVGGIEAPQGWRVRLNPPKPEPEAHVSPNEFLTSDVTNRFVVTIFNNGPKGDKLRQALIAIPAVFTNFDSFTPKSSLLGTANIEKLTLNGTNWLWLKYHEATTNIGSVNDVFGQFPSDEITLDLADGEAFNTNRYWFWTYADNTPDPDFPDNLSSTNQATVTTGKQLYADLLYPPVAASFDVQSRFTNNYLSVPTPELTKIDATTSTNTIVVRVSNAGAWGNFIKKVWIDLPASFGTEIVPGSGSSQILSYLGNVQFIPEAIGQPPQVMVDYQAAGTNIPAGLVDTISFKFIDTKTDHGYAQFKVTVANDREEAELSLLDLLSEGSASIEFYVPPAQAKVKFYPSVLIDNLGPAEETTVVCTVSNTGGGSNNLTKAKIIFPSVAGVSVLSASNSHLAFSIPNHGTSLPFKLDESGLEIDYGADPLPPGKSDLIHLRVQIDKSDTDLPELKWDVEVANSGTETNSTKEIIDNGKTQQMSGRPLFGVFGADEEQNSVLASNVTNTVTIKVRNSTDDSSQALKRIKVSVPEPFKLPADLLNSSLESTITNSGRDLIVDCLTVFSGNYANALELKFTDDFDEAETNTVWELHADYGDGFWHEVYSEQLVDNKWFTDVLSIVLPPAQAQAWLEPDYIFADVVESRLRLTVLNDGGFGNHIRLVEISTTNEQINELKSVESTIPGVEAAWQDGKLLVLYKEGRLKVGSHDVISFTCVDEIDAPSIEPVPWVVRVANINDPARLQPTRIPPGKTLHSRVINPGIRAEFHLTPEILDTSSEFNILTLYIDNKSPQDGELDSLIEAARVYFDETIFVTNGIEISSREGATISLGENYIDLTYPLPIAPKAGDLLTVKLKDIFEQGDTNTILGLDVKFDTVSYYTNADIANGTNRIEFKMPLPEVEYGFVVRDLYTTHTNANLSLWVTNRASGSNALEDFIITLPDVFKEAFVSLEPASGISLDYDDQLGLITAGYPGGLKPGAGDFYTLGLVNPRHTVGTFALQAIASNSTFEAQAIANGLSNVIRVVTPPQTRLSPNTIDTTTSVNTVKVHLNNTGSGDTAVLRARIKVPAIYNRVLAVESERVLETAITNLGNDYFIEYGEAQIAHGASDTLTFVLEDDFNEGTADVAWQVLVDNGNGYATTAEVSTGAMTQSFKMPAVAASGWLNTVWVYAANDPGAVVTNSMSLSISNQGQGSNYVRQVEIKFPANLMASAQIKGISSSRHGLPSVSSGTIYMNYLADPIKPGEHDEISFVLEHSIDNARSFNVVFGADNFDGNGYVKIQAPSTPVGAQQRLDIFIKEEDPEAYLAGAKAPYVWENVTDTTIYTMDDEAILKYVIKNKSRRLSVKRVVIPLSNSFVIKDLTSQLASGDSGFSYSHETNTLVLDWVGSNFAPQASETLTISVGYDSKVFEAQINDNGGKNLTNLMPARVLYLGSQAYLSARGNERDLFVVENANFGRLRGKVLPLGIGPIVTLKEPGRESIATNVLGQTLQALINTNTGFYILDKIPPNLPYQMVVQPPVGETLTNNGRLVEPVNYETFQVSGLSVPKNTVQDITNIVLSYGRLNIQARGDQVILSPEDSKTKLVVPPGTLFEGISVNILREEMSPDQQAFANNTPTQIERPLDSASLWVWHFKVIDLRDNTVLENGFKKDVEIELSYEDLEVQGWPDESLGIWYWKPSTKEWIFIGGRVDSQTKTIKARVSYLHARYAVMGQATTQTRAIHSVRSSPNPFTPGRGDGQFSNLKISFAFARAHESYEVKIYNMQGQLVRQYNGDGIYSQGEVFWDGRDKNGFKVRGGVYLYQITAGSSTFSGSVLVLR